MEPEPGLESKPGPVPGQKRKSQSSENEWVEYWSPRKNHKYWHNPSTGESVWKKPSSPAQPAISSSSLPPELLKMQVYMLPSTDAETTSSKFFEDFLKGYQTEQDSDIREYFSKINTVLLNQKNGQKKAIQHFIKLFDSYVKYKKKKHEKHGIIGLYYYANGHAGIPTVTIRNYQIDDLSKKITICAPPGCFSFGSIGKTCFGYFSHIVDNEERMTRSKKEPARERTSRDYIYIEDACAKIVSSLEKASSKISTYTSKKISQWEISKYIKIYIAKLLTKVNLSEEWEAYVKSNKFDRKLDEDFTDDDFSQALKAANEIIDGAIFKNTKIKTNCRYAVGSVGKAFKTINTTKMEKEKKRTVWSNLQLLYSDSDLNANIFLRLKVIFDDMNDEYVEMFNFAIFQIRSYLKMLYMDKIIEKGFKSLKIDKDTSSYQLELDLVASSKTDDIIREVNQCDAIFIDEPGYTLKEDSMAYLFLTELHLFYNRNNLDLKRIVVKDKTNSEALDPTRCFSLTSTVLYTSVEHYVVHGCRNDCGEIRGPNNSDIDEDSQTPGGRKKTRKRIRGNNRNRAKTRGRK